MNLSEEQKSRILELDDLGLSQNAISKELNISKPYVNAVIKKHRNISGLNGFQQIPVNTPVNLPVNLPVNRHEFTGNNSNAESYYLKKQITDLEARLKEYKDELANEKLEHNALRKKNLLLEVDFNSQEQKHRLELERKDQAISQSGKSALNGLIDPVIGPFTKNDKFMESFGTGIAKMIEAKLLGGGMPNPATNLAAAHPQAADPEVQKWLTEIPQALNAFEKANLFKLYELIGLFLAPNFPDMLSNVHNQVINHIKNQTQ